MDASPFARLPGELRNRIWRSALIETNDSILMGATTPVPALLATCHQIRQECHGIYFGENVFHLPHEVYVPDLHPLAKDCLRRIGHQGARTIQNLKLVSLRNEKWPQPRLSEFDEELARARRQTWKKELDSDIAEAITRCLLAVGLRLDAVEVSDSTEEEKASMKDVHWTLMKEALDMKLAEAKGSLKGTDEAGVGEGRDDC